MGKDVAKMLGYNQSDKAILRHTDEDDRMKCTVTDNLGRGQSTFVINESSSYGLILLEAICSHVEAEDNLIRQIVVSGQRRRVIFINESGLYGLILSLKPSAAIWTRKTMGSRNATPSAEGRK